MKHFFILIMVFLISFSFLSAPLLFAEEAVKPAVPTEAPATEDLAVVDDEMTFEDDLGPNGEVVTRDEDITVEPTEPSVETEPTQL